MFMNRLTKKKLFLQNLATESTKRYIERINELTKQTEHHKISFEVCKHFSMTQ